MSIQGQTTQAATTGTSDNAPATVSTVDTPATVAASQHPTGIATRTSGDFAGQASIPTEAAGGAAASVKLSASSASSEPATAKTAESQAESQAPEAQAPEAQAPEAPAPEAQAPEAPAPEAPAPAAGPSTGGVDETSNGVDPDDQVSPENNTVTLTLKYYDDNQILKPDIASRPPVVLTGQIGQTGTYTVDVPANYQLAPGQPATVSYTFTTDGAVQYIHLVHILTPKQVDTHRYIVYFVQGLQIQPPERVIQTVNWNGKIDTVTGWYLDFVPTQTEYPEQITPVLPGYTPELVNYSGSLPFPPTSIPALPVSKMGFSGQPGDPTNWNIMYVPDMQHATVNFVDKAGNEVIPPQHIQDKTLTKVDHSTINIQAAMDKGYTLYQDGTLGARYDDLTGQDQIYTVVLTPIEKASVTTNLVPHDSTGRLLSPDKPVSYTGKPGDLITTDVELPSVPGYTPDLSNKPQVPEPTRTDHKLTEPDTPITYLADAQTVTVHYLDEQGNQIVTDTLLTGVTDQPINHALIAPNIQEAIAKGYSLVADQTVGAKFDNIADSKAKQNLTIKFVPIEAANSFTPLIPEDPFGNPLKPVNPVTIKGKPGDLISLTQLPKVPGYTPRPGQNLKVPDDPTNPNGPITVIYETTINTADGIRVYTVDKVDDPVSAVTFALQPQGPDGESIGTPIQLVGNPGEPISKKDIPESFAGGYQLIPDQFLTVPNTSRTTVSVLYSQTKSMVDEPPFVISNPAQPGGKPDVSISDGGLPNTQGDPTAPDQNLTGPSTADSTAIALAAPASKGLLSSASQTPGKAVKSGRVLPRTGNAHQSGLVALGAALLALMGFGTLEIRRKA
ncbi:hypothetical protein FD02_GL000854 [Lacticaseibacillus nasuensis JCM 17158]|uniref:Mucin binding domain-containing protein n=2 Tax=Lacticaseibacillus TaxID=2759736 RepID=A0A0R1JSG6_9LACO|nr:hypothetical protein FD02_GL000854 [Lacticaseibacillus nasuensis JCM 17158]